jgi:uncharacterized protein YeaO (DUF488 family)
MAPAVSEIRIKRVYDASDKDDGTRVLVDRLWPRGLRKEEAALTLWLKEIAPSAELRNWFGHDPARWTEFGHRYRAELAGNDAAVARLTDLLKRGPVALLYAAHDTAHNHALVLAVYLREHWMADQVVSSREKYAEFASPACSAHEMNDRYMGFAGPDELLATLNELLEAERAGAQVTLRTTNDVAEPDLKSLVTTIYHDEARWCGMLTKAVRQLGGIPSQATGAFHDKAMAIRDIPERLAFINRGQGWVVHKLKTLLPTVRDDAVHANLATMLASHEQNIDLVTGYLPQPSANASS